MDEETKVTEETKDNVNLGPRNLSIQLFNLSSCPIPLLSATPCWRHVVLHAGRHKAWSRGEMQAQPGCEIQEGEVEIGHFIGAGG